MGVPRIEDAFGPINGANKRFETTGSYLAGSLRVWVNGILLHSGFEDGFTEGGGKTFHMKEAPLSESTVRVYYISL